MFQLIVDSMKTYSISFQEIVELKQTMGFRVDSKIWDEFLESHPKGCTNHDMIEYVKKWADPSYDVADPDAYLEEVMKLFLGFVRE